LSTTQLQNVQISALKDLSPRKALTVILGLSAVIFGFLIWLVYYKQAANYSSELIGNLGAVNAFWNFVTTVFLLMGFREIKRRNFDKHLKYMFAALAASSLFFIGYVVYHAFHGETKFMAEGIIRPVYFFVLISHIVLSAVSVPLILTSFYLSLAGKFEKHRIVSRWTFPLWLYVSVTGVVIFAMLKIFTA
jgi:putative membrane protein